MRESLSSPLRKLIGRIARGTSGSPFEEAARQFKAVPLHAGWFGWYLLTDRGEVIEVVEDGSVSPVTEPLRTMCLVEGAERYPELLSFLPVRPPSALTCERCQGSGWMALDDQGGKIRCGDCRALGWVEDHTKDPPSS